MGNSRMFSITPISHYTLYRGSSNAHKGTYKGILAIATTVNVVILL